MNDNQGRNGFNDFGLYDRSNSYSTREVERPSASEYTNVPSKQSKAKLRRERRAAIRKRKIKKFIAIVLTLVSSFLLISFGCIFTYIKLMVDPDEQENIYNLMSSSMNSAMEVNIPTFTKSRITALLVGVDKEGQRTDTMMIATVNRKTNQVDLISIPRDTRISVPDKVIDKYNKATGYNYKHGWKIKLTEYNAYVSVLSDYSMDYLVEEIESLLSIDIDYYAKIDTEAFVEVIDSLGGIDYNVPTRMYYVDPDQNLRIDLQPGMQHLSGKEAEGLVRMRHCYIDEDYGRMDTQKQFLIAVFDQVLDKVSITNLPALIKTMFTYVDTNFKVTDIPMAVSVLSSMDTNNIKTHTIPSRPADIGGISYVIHDQAGTDELIYSIWYPERTDNTKEALTWGEY